MKKIRKPCMRPSADVSRHGNRGFDRDRQNSKSVSNLSRVLLRQTKQQVRVEPIAAITSADKTACPD